MACDFDIVNDVVDVDVNAALTKNSQTTFFPTKRAPNKIMYLASERQFIQNYLHSITTSTLKS